MLTINNFANFMTTAVFFLLGAAVFITYLRRRHTKMNERALLFVVLAFLSMGISLALPVGESFTAWKTLTGVTAAVCFYMGLVPASGRPHLKQQSAALDESEAKFRSLFESAPTGIIMVDHHGRITKVNQQAAEMFAYQASALEGQKLEQLLPQRLRDIHRQHRQHYFVTPQARKMGVGLDLVGRRQNNTELPIEVGLSYIKSDEELMAIAFITDISERKMGEQRLRERENKLALSLQAAGAGVWTWDIITDEIIWDEALEKIYGLEPSAFDGFYESWAKLIHPADFDDAEQAILDALAGVTPFDTEFRVIWPDGTIRYLSGQGVILRDEEQQPVQMIGVNVDITERKKTEAEIRRLNTDLERRVRERTAHLMAVNKELEAFSYSVSHDLRAPLRAVDGFSLALLEDYDDLLDEMGRDFLWRIRKESQRMGQLIDDLIDLSRYSRTEIKVQMVNLSTIVHTIAAELKENEPERKAEFIIQNDLMASVDESLIRAALQNLLSNAWKFTAKKPATLIEFGRQEQENGAAVFFVRDNGAGFDMAYANKLFGAFQRLHTTAEFEGTGIGLATVQRIIHRHGGSVWAESELGQGATFYFTLGHRNIKRTRGI
ncbi:MAG: PAS domain S-box protein [Anaerolineales bacterium]|nr:PAS domain S-box protein [Anaerolineales bacterium]